MNCPIVTSRGVTMAQRLLNHILWRGGTSKQSGEGSRAGIWASRYRGVWPGYEPRSNDESQSLRPASLELQTEKKQFLGWHGGRGWIRSPDRFGGTCLPSPVLERSQASGTPVERVRANTGGCPGPRCGNGGRCSRVFPARPAADLRGPARPALQAALSLRPQGVP